MDENNIVLTLTADKYARFVRISGLGDGIKYSDNYFDILPDEVKKISISAGKPIKADDIIINHWLTDWER